MESLAHLCTAMCKQDRAIVIDVNQSTCLVEKEGGKRNSKLGWNQGHASLVPFVCFVKFVNLLAPASIVRLFLNLLPHEWDVPVPEFLVEMCGLARLVHV